MIWKCQTTHPRGTGTAGCRMAEFRQASEADKEKMIRLLNEKSSYAAQSQRVETMLEQA